MNLDFVQGIFLPSQKPDKNWKDGSVIKSIRWTTLSLEPDTQTSQVWSHKHACSFCCQGQKQMDCLKLLAARI